MLLSFSELVVTFFALASGRSRARKAAVLYLGAVKAHQGSRARESFRGGCEVAA